MLLDLLDKVNEAIDKLDIDEDVANRMRMAAVMGIDTEGIIGVMHLTYNQKATEEAERDTPNLSSPEYDPFDQRIVDMFTESTGVDIMDSGGKYGRHWQHNRMIPDLNMLRPATIDVEIDEDGQIKSILPTINTYKYLQHYLDIDNVSEELNSIMHRELKNGSRWDAKEFVIDYAVEVLGLYEDTGFNTYNFETLLSQGFQGTLLVDNERQGIYSNNVYIIIELHNGADIRGGYTKPQVFKLYEPEYFWLGLCDFVITCDCGRIYTDDCGYHWYNDGYEYELNEHGFPESWWAINDSTIYCRECDELVELYPSLVE